ncbi:hypothetical protein [Mycobacterium sp. NPDC050041]|uniref:hypothetical protein n=1 Tax=Mycobacterium sp. NPDC050041 TaxID=3364293 RepID=UPI003C2E8ED5
MRSQRRYLTWGVAAAAIPVAVIVSAPPAEADCTYSGGTTICAQGDVRGADGVPRAATAGVPYPCENDWYCNTDWDLDVAWDPGIDRPDGPNRPNRPNRPGGGGGGGRGR